MTFNCKLKATSYFREVIQHRVSHLTKQECVQTEVLRNFCKGAAVGITSSRMMNPVATTVVVGVFLHSAVAKYVEAVSALVMRLQTEILEESQKFPGLEAST